MKMFTLAIAATTSAFLFTSAIAVPAAAQGAVVIDYADIDIASEQGTTLLAERIEAGAQDVCAQPDRRSVSSLRMWQDCVADVHADAREQLARNGVTL